MSTIETEGSSRKSKSKGKVNVDYDASRFTGKNEEKLYNKVWVRNGAVIKRKLNIVALENTDIRFVQNFMYVLCSHTSCIVDLHPSLILLL